MVEIHRAPTRELGIERLYAILRLRAEVFIVEQETSYLDPDGRDLEPSTIQFWAEDDGLLLATLRLLDDVTEAHIGRVVTAASARGRGLAADLLRAALVECVGREVVLDAQAHLEHWYGRFGFVRQGEDYDLDGIPHVTMRRPAETAASAISS